MAIFHQSLNGNGSATPLKGSGLNHRHLDQDQRARLAADVVTGVRPFVPSCEQACVTFAIPRYRLAKHLKARKSVNGTLPTVQCVEVTAPITLGSDGVVSADIPAIIAALQAYVDATPATREAKLAAMLAVLENFTTPVNKHNGGSPSTRSA
jgi:hypothetical protein